MKRMDQESLISSARFCFVSVQNSVVTNLQVDEYKLQIEIDKWIQMKYIDRWIPTKR